MPTSVASQMRRMQRLMRPPKMTKATKSLLAATAAAPFTMLAAQGKPLRKTAAKPKSAPQGRPSPRVPAGASFVARNHRSAWGSRGYMLYLPASAAKKPKGVILMLHGCGQNPHDFALGTHMNAHAEKHGLAVAYPEQTKRHNRGLCWNWFRPGHQLRSAGEPAMLASLARKLTREFALTRDAVFVAGLSAGGSMAAILADVYPDVFAAAGIHSGLARGSAFNVSSAMSAMRKGGANGRLPAITPLAFSVRRIVFQGDSDRTVHPSNAPQIIAAALGEEAQPLRTATRSVRGRQYTRDLFAASDQAGALEFWSVEGAGHAWSGGRVKGSYTDKQGPDASAQMMRFFLEKP
jgi:poly(hydroxyalkanoate) depolymerase family esterase